MASAGFICKLFAPGSIQINTPASHHHSFYGLDALLDAQPTVSKHWRHTIISWYLFSLNTEHQTHRSSFITILQPCRINMNGKNAADNVTDKATPPHCCKYLYTNIRHIHTYTRNLWIVCLHSNRILNRIGRPIQFRIEFSNRIGRIYHASRNTV